MQPSQFSGPPIIYIDGVICFRVVMVGFLLFAALIVLADLLQRIQTAKYGQFAEGYIKELLSGRGGPTPVIAFTLPDQRVITFLHNSGSALYSFKKVGTPVRVLYDPARPTVRAYWYRNRFTFFGTNVTITLVLIVLAYVVGADLFIPR